jgi:hypothetical protein
MKSPPFQRLPVHVWYCQTFSYVRDGATLANVKIETKKGLFLILSIDVFKLVLGTPQ